MKKQGVCMGVPVYFAPKLRLISESRGLFRWKKIVVGPDFNRLPPREQMAILAHEAGHCRLGHLEARLRAVFNLRLLSFARLRELCQRHEYEADAFAMRAGYGPDLVRLFERMRGVSSGPLHPSLESRIARLKG